MPIRTRAFTLIETMLVVLLLAIVASAAALTFSQPIAQARADDAFDQLRSFDANARIAAKSSGKVVRVVFDLSDNRLDRREGGNLKDTRYSVHLPAGCRIEAVRIGRQSTTFGEVPLDLSAMGLSRSYAVHVVGPATDRWAIFAGLTGEMNVVANETAVRQILEPDAK